MILYLGVGILILLLVLWLVRAFVEADPAKLARGVRMLLISAGATLALLLLVVLIASDRIGLGLTEIAGLSPVALRAWMYWRRQRPASAPHGQASEVETEYLRMRLDHDTATMSGTVRRGPFMGRHLSELKPEELLELWRRCRADDPQGASLLEAYLDRSMPGWREAAESAEAGAGPRHGAGAMSREEAYAILDLPVGAGESQIREAYHRLMKKLHPDQGGSTYLAAQLNRARERLLHP